VSINRLMDELATVAPAGYDSETRFKAMAARGSRQTGLALLDRLDRGFATRSRRAAAPKRQDGLTMQTRVSSKGRVVLPSPVRRKLGLGPGDPLDVNISPLSSAEGWRRSRDRPSRSERRTGHSIADERAGRGDSGV
jgi:AbrB family looped-hinge helix DNA binding protein